MMTASKIAFISQLAEEQQLAWQQVLNSAFHSLDQECHVLRDDELTDDEKAQVSIAIVANPEPQKLANYPNLIWAHSLWAGVEKLIAELPSPNFKLARLVDPVLAETMAQAVVAWSYYLLRDMPIYQVQQKDQSWHQHDVKLTSEVNVGVLGLGELGQRACSLLLANGFNVSGWSRSAKTVAGVSCYSGSESLTKMLAQQDIVVCLLPLTNETYHLFNSTLFSQLKKGVSLINFARGAIISDEDLLSALEQEQVKHAVLDVFAIEPLPKSHPFWQHSKITVLPHISAPTNRQSACKIVTGNIVRYLDCGELPATVDFNRQY